MTDVFDITVPAGKTIPIVLSIPHAGTQFPAELLGQYKHDKLPPDDTDWFVDELYSFASDMGITTIKANYSRWVIDLNRNPDSQPLYNDGRVITGLCPTTDFLGQSIYKDERTAVSDEEIARRRTLYFGPYHQHLQTMLDEVKGRFGKVLLWDCHSIRRQVPSIQKAPFPDMILGNADETSADATIIQTALQALQSANHQLAHNHPFKGGFITRHFGKPAQHQHTLQLEMCKDLYMDDTEETYHPERAAQMQNLLKQTFQQLTPLLLS